MDISRLDEINPAFDEYCNHYDKIDLLVNNRGTMVGAPFFSDIVKNIKSR
jgi:NADP-dependent 3-hydroxy acid dehydrogenase YdfG